MNYQCARAISVEKKEDIILKTFSDKNRKGLTPSQWQDEMNHEIKMTNLAKLYVNCPEVKKVNDFSYEMSYCGEPIDKIRLRDLITIKDMERDLIHYARLYHNDLKPENILQKDGEFYFIDFGHATIGEPDKPFFNHLSIFQLDNLTRVQIDEKIMQIMANTNAHGGRISYYGEDNKKGIRDWTARWSVLKDACDYDNKRILDLGCNQGMFLCYIAENFNPNFCMGVDASEDIILAANLTALKKHANAYFKHLNIANGDNRNKHFSPTKNWKEDLGYDWDIVSALSLYHWVCDKDDLLDYLFNFPCVLMEAHGLGELDELVVKFVEKKYKSYIVYQGSDEKYDRPIVRFQRDS